MIYRNLVLLGLALICHFQTYAQNNPGEDMLVWFKTEPTIDLSDPTDIDRGRWLDHSGNEIELEYKYMENSPEADYVDKVYSMNYNRALYFREQFISEYFCQLKSNINTTSTIMAVLVPNKRETALQEDWSMRWNYGGPTERVLTVDEVLQERQQLGQQYVDHLLDYGETLGTDQLIKSGEDHYEKEKYGRIVTYNAYLTGDRCTSSNSVLAKAFNLYSDSEVAGLLDREDGQIAELIVFKKILTEEERFIYESYLAIKYGISKELNYVDIDGNIIWESTDMSVFSHRHTGIGVYSDYGLFQSRSNSYYAETLPSSPINSAAGRFDPYSDVHNYSEHPDRLLTISAEDESVTIAGGSLVWGDDDIDIYPMEEVTFDESEYTRIPRNWGITKIEGGEVVTPSWCNFVNLNKNLSGDIQLTDMFPTGSTVTTAGHMASSTPMTVDPASSLTWTIEALGSGNDNSVIGISDDNYSFADVNGNVFASDDGTIEGYTHFLVACISDGNDYNIVYDVHGDGKYDLNTAVQIFPNNGDIMTIQLDRTVISSRPDEPIGSLQAKILINGVIVEERIWPSGQGGIFDCWRGDNYFAKMIMSDPSFQIGDVQGMGFEEVNAMGSNVELSYTRIKPDFEASYPFSIENYTPYLIIDRSGDALYSKENTDFIKGGYGKTEGATVPSDGLYDKIEFSSVDWDTDGSIGIPNSDAFTFGFRDCSIPAEIEVDVIECCGDILDVCFRVKDCPENRLMDFVIESTSEGGSIDPIEGKYTIDKDHCIGQPLGPGDYNLIVELANCQSLEFPFSVEPIDRTNIITQELWEIPGNEISIDINISSEIPRWLRESDELMITWINDVGQEVATGTEFLGATEGTYTIQFVWECSNGGSCTFEDTIEVRACGHLTIATSLNSCCRSADLTVTNLGDCPIIVRLKTNSEFIEETRLEPGESGEPGESHNFNCLLASGDCSEFIYTHELGVALYGENLDDIVFEWQDVVVECADLPSEIVQITECPLSVQVDHLNMGDLGFQYDWYRVSDDELIAANTPVFPLPVTPGQYYVVATTSCAPEECSEPCQIIEYFDINLPFTLDHEIINQCCNSADLKVTYDVLYDAEIKLHTIVVDRLGNGGGTFDESQFVSPGAGMIEFTCLGAFGDCTRYTYKHSLSIDICGYDIPYQELIQVDCTPLPDGGLLDDDLYTIDECDAISILDDGFHYTWYSADGTELGSGSSFPGPCVAGEYYVLATLCEPDESCTIEIGLDYTCEKRSDFTISCEPNITLEIGNQCCGTADLQVNYGGDCIIYVQNPIDDEVIIIDGSGLAIFDCLVAECTEGSLSYTINYNFDGSSDYTPLTQTIECIEWPDNLLGDNPLEFSQSQCPLITAEEIDASNNFDAYPGLVVTYVWTLPDGSTFVGPIPDISACILGTYEVTAIIECGSVDCSNCEIIDEFVIGCSPGIASEIINQCCERADLQVTNTGDCILYVQNPESESHVETIPIGTSYTFECLDAECIGGLLSYNIDYGVEENNLSSNLVETESCIAWPQSLLEGQLVFSESDCPIDIDASVNFDPYPGLDVTYVWTLPDGATSIGPMPDVSSCMPGIYEVAAHIECGSTDCNCDISDSFEIVADVDCSTFELSYTAELVYFNQEGSTNLVLQLVLDVTSSDSRCENYLYSITYGQDPYPIEGMGMVGESNTVYIDIPDDEPLESYTINIMGTDDCNCVVTAESASGCPINNSSGQGQNAAALSAAADGFIIGVNCFTDQELESFTIDENIFPSNAGLCVQWTITFDNDAPTIVGPVSLDDDSRTIVINWDDISDFATMNAEVTYCDNPEVCSWEANKTVYSSCPHARVIVNEISNGPSGSKEYIELMVLGDGTCDFVDIRGYLLDDNNGDFSNPDRGTNSSTGISPGHNRFALIDRWANVPPGSLILIYNANDINGSIPAPDPEDVDNDGVYILPHTDLGLEGVSGIPSSSNDSYDVSGYSSASWSYMALSNSRDAYQIRYPNASYCHGFAYGSSTYMSGGPDSLLIPGTGSKKVMTFTNGNVRDISNYEKKTVSIATESPGAANAEANEYYQANQTCDEGETNRADIIINEFSNGISGNQEFVELLVTSCDPLDMRRMILDDNNGDFSAGDPIGTGIAPGHIRFKDVNEWSSIPSGALIVIYNADQKNSSIYQADDPTDSNNDLVYILSSDDPLLEGTSSKPSVNDATYNTPDEDYGSASWGMIIMANTGDAVQLRKPKGEFIHGFSYGSSGLSGGPGDLLIHPSNGAQRDFFFNSGNIWYDQNYGSKNILTGFVPLPSIETPGDPNNTANEEYINFLCFQSDPDTIPAEPGQSLIAPTGSADVYNKMTIEVMNPAPASRDIQVTIRQKLEPLKTKVWVYDIRGAQIDLFEFGQEVSSTFMINLPQGTYILKAIDDTGQVAVKKLVVIQ